MRLHRAEFSVCFSGDPEQTVLDAIAALEGVGALTVELVATRPMDEADLVPGSPLARRIARAS